MSEPPIYYSTTALSDWPFFGNLRLRFPQIANYRHCVYHYGTGSVTLCDMEAVGCEEIFHSNIYGDKAKLLTPWPYKELLVVNVNADRNNHGFIDWHLEKHVTNGGFAEPLRVQKEMFSWLAAKGNCDGEIPTDQRMYLYRSLRSDNHMVRGWGLMNAPIRCAFPWLLLAP